MAAASGGVPLSRYRKPSAVPRSGSGCERLLAGADARERGEGGGRDGGQLARLLHGRRPAGRLLRAPGGDGGAQGVHGVCRRRQVAQRGEGPLGQRTAWQVGRGRPFAGPQQLRDLGVRPCPDQLHDGVAAIQQSTGLAVDECDRGLPRDDACEAGRVGSSVRRLVHGPESRRRRPTPLGHSRSDAAGRVSGPARERGRSGDRVTRLGRRGAVRARWTRRVPSAAAARRR